MFFPDKPRAAGEVYRVVKPGGTFLFNVWDAIELNDRRIVFKVVCM
jgi:ubiquinone/menaquinone biosynthesis C-methylase UbiE